MSMKGRSFLKLLDFTPEEITQLIDTAADLKQKKKAGVPLTRSKERTSRSSLKRPARARAAASRLPHTIWAWA